MKFWSLAAAAMALFSCPVFARAFPHTADRHDIARPAMTRADWSDATSEVLACTNQSPIPVTCDREWRGIKWILVTKTWTAQLDLPNGTRWFSHCRYDMIYRQDQCFWSTGDEFHIARSDGYSTVVSWGVQRFPGSQMIAKFDDRTPISTSHDEWSATESGAIYSEMLTGKLLRYRWYSWPEKLERGGIIKLAGFHDAAALLEAVRDEFSVKRALNKIPVDQ